jgi:protein-disulfide isomerase
MSQKRIALLTLILAAVAFALGIYVYDSRAKPTPALQTSQAQSLVRSHSPVYGQATAKVTIVEFFDPACESCRAFYPIVKRIVDSSFGQVKLVLRYAPLHRGSDMAVQILEAARKQGLYWQVLEKVLDTQPTWADHNRPQPELIWELVQGTGLDVARARRDFQGDDIAKILALDKADLVAFKVDKTPTFIVNGTSLTRFGVDELRALVRSELARVRPQ